MMIINNNILITIIKNKGINHSYIIDKRNKTKFN